MAFRMFRSRHLSGVRFASLLHGSGAGKTCKTGGSIEIRRALTGIGEYGSGSGKGGGAGGSIREAGGAFGKMEAANEEMYFRKLQALQLQRIKEHLEEEVEHHERSVRSHEEAIERHKKKIKKLQHDEENIKKKH